MKKLQVIKKVCVGLRINTRMSETLLGILFTPDRLWQFIHVGTVRMATHLHYNTVQPRLSELVETKKKCSDNLGLG